jgi:hypothetical protein
MEIRLMGTKSECDVAAAYIAQVLTVLSKSRPYANRGTDLVVRVFLDVRIPSPAENRDQVKGEIEKS